MKFPAFLSFLELKGTVQTRSDVLYQSKHDFKHSDKDELALYCVIKITIIGNSENAEVIYSYERFKGNTTYKMINCDIFFNEAFSPMKHDSLFIKNASVSRLIETFIKEYK